MTATTTATTAVASSVPRAWMRLPSGAHLDLIDPNPLAWQDADLATRLARTYRWGGESIWSLPLSVAQHCLLVLQLRRQTSPVPLTIDDELLDLLHDAEEGFLGFDCIAPLKPVLGPGFKAVADRLMQAVCSRYQLAPWTVDGHALHKIADVAAAAAEAVHIVGWTAAEVRAVLGIEAPVVEFDPLVARYGGQVWAPWPADLAAARFLEELQRLLAIRKGAPANIGPTSAPLRMSAPAGLGDNSLAPCESCVSGLVCRP